MALQNVEANITLDLYNHDTTPATVKAIQLDSQTRYVAAMLQSMGAEYGLDSGATVQLIVIRPDKVGVQITGTTFTYGDEGAQFLGPYAELTQVALAVNGKMRGQFKITSGTQILRTEIFAISNGEALDASTDEWADEYDGYNLEEMAADISQIKEDLNDIINSAYVTDSASGGVAHFEDGANDVPMKSVVIDTESASATVTKTGKNLVDFADLACEANTNYTQVLGTVYLPAGTYTFSASIDKTITATRNRLRIAYDAIAVYGDEDFKQIGRSSSTFTLDSAKTVTFSWWYHTLSESIVLSDIQLEYASADTEYEAYNGNTYNVTLVNGVVQEEIKSLLGINNVWSDAGDMDVEYRANTKLYIDKRLGV